MEHRRMRLAAVSLYIIILSVHMKWNLFVLFDIQMVFFVLAGTTIYVCFDCRENPTLKKVVASVKESLYPVGILCSFLLVFYQCYNTGTADFSFSELAMNLRPLFYTVVTSFILDKKENVISSDKKPPYNKADTEQQIYFYLKEQGFTEREIEVTNLMRKNLSNYEIGEELYITEATVKKHVTHIYEKSGVSGRRQLIQYCKAVIK